MLIWAGLLLDATALAINALWLVKLIRSAGEEVRKRRKDGRDYTRYRDAYNQWLTERDYAQGNADTAYDRGYNQWLQQWNQFNTDRNYQLEKENADRQYQLQLEQFRWQQEQAAQAQAAAAAKSSGGGSSSGGSGGSKNTGSSSYKDTTAYSRALAYAKAGAQSRRTANLLNGFVQRGEITAAQAEQIMNELY